MPEEEKQESSAAAIEKKTASYWLDRAVSFETEGKNGLAEKCFEKALEAEKAGRI